MYIDIKENITENNANRYSNIFDITLFKFSILNMVEINTKIKPIIDIIKAILMSLSVLLSPIENIESNIKNENINIKNCNLKLFLLLSVILISCFSIFLCYVIDFPIFKVFDHSTLQLKTKY